MKKYIDISEFIGRDTIQSVTTKVVSNFVLRRKELKLSRQAISKKSNVPYGTIRRFEETGNISFKSLLNLAVAIDALSDFSSIFSTRKVVSLKDEWNK